MSKHPAKWCMCPAYDWNAKSQDRMETTIFHEYLMGKAFLWDTHETFYFARLSFLIHTFYTYTIYTHITHRCWGVLQRENPSHKPWELEIVIPTYLYTIACGFSSTPTSPFPYHWEVDSSNTYHTLSECSVRFLVLLGSIGRSQFLAYVIWRITGSGKLDKTRFWEALLE